VQFLGWQNDTSIRNHFRKARALLFPGFEDFGIVPVEAQACGLPVIALGRGGATETVIGLDSKVDPTGVFFEEPSTESLSAAIRKFEHHQKLFDPAAARRQALQFSLQHYEQGMMEEIQRILGTSELHREAA